MRSHHTFRIGIAVAAGTLAAGCGASPSASSASSPPASSAPAASTPASPRPSEATPSSPTPSPPTSVTSSGPAPLPTLTKPGKPPREPTDNLPNTGWVTGMVTRGGSGPCYGLTADDGTRYALYNGDGITLEAGDHVQVKLETTLLKIYCGPGRLMAMTEATPVK